MPRPIVPRSEALNPKDFVRLTSRLGTLPLLGVRDILLGAMTVSNDSHDS